MKNLYKKLIKSNLEKTIAILLAFIIIFSPYIGVKAQKTPATDPDQEIPGGEAEETTPCMQYVLVWESDGANVKPYLNDTSTFINVPPPLRTDTTDSSTPPYDGAISSNGKWNIQALINQSSSRYSDPLVTWKCNSYANETAAEGLSNNIPGTEACEAAVRYARSFGWAVASRSPENTLEGLIGENILKSVFASLQKGLDININVKKEIDELVGTSTTKIVNGIIKLVKGDSSEFFEAIGLKNEFKKQVEKTKNEIVNAAKKELEKNIKSKLVKQAKEILNLPGTEETKVPVIDEDSKKELIKISGKQDTQIQQEETRKVIESTRVRCNLLLQQTIQQIKNSLLYQFTTQTVDWIEGGGIEIKDNKVIVHPPQYIKKPGKFLEKTAREAVDRWLSNVAPQLCQPFRMRVTLEIPSTARYTNPYYEPYLRCTLDRIIDNIQDFYNDFRSGGWIGYREILYPQNNYYGASLLASQRLAEIQSAALSAAQNEINTNQGFISQNKCVGWHKFIKAEVENINDCRPENFENRSVRWIPEGNIAGNDYACYYIPSSEPAYIFEAKETTDDGKEIGIGIPEDIPKNKWQEYINQGIDFTGHNVFLPSDSDPDGINKSFFYECVDYEITQPAAVSKKLLEKTVEADIDAIVNAQDLMNVEQIISNAIINKITKVGITGIKGLLSKLPLWTNNLDAIKNFGKNQ